MSHEVIVSLIGNTTTQTGLKVVAALDQNLYPKGRVIPKSDMKKLDVVMIGPHEGWSYIIKPKPVK